MITIHSVRSGHHGCIDGCVDGCTDGCVDRHTQVVTLLDCSVKSLGM